MYSPTLSYAHCNHPHKDSAMTVQAKRHPWKFERREREPTARRRPELDVPDNTPVPSGVRPDLDEPGDDGQGGTAGGVGKSI
jgi:hypothetical protein